MSKIVKVNYRDVKRRQSRTLRDRTDKFSKARDDASKLRDRNCCALIAVTVITGKSYEDVFDMFAARGRRRGHGTQTWTTHAVLRDCGFTLERMKRLPKTVNQCEQKLSKTKVFLIHTSCHVLAMRAGEVHDHSRGSKRIPKDIYRVIRKRKKSVADVAEWAYDQA